MHLEIEPAILYLGTPVALITTENEDGSFNVAPNSSMFWLGWSCMLGLDRTSQTTKNLIRTGHCVLNMATFDMANSVNELSMFTGSQSVPLHKKLLGYQYRKDKLSGTGLTTKNALSFKGLRIMECPIQLEAKLVNCHDFARNDPKMAISAASIELQIVRVHAEEAVILDSDRNKIDPSAWHPLIMSFRRYFGVTESQVKSKLFSGDENLYAPWKLTGLLGWATRLALNLSVKN